MYKEPLMIEKYEALQELYLKDPLTPLSVSLIPKHIFFECVGNHRLEEGIYMVDSLVFLNSFICENEIW